MRMRCATRSRASATASGACSSCATAFGGEYPCTLDEVGRTFNVTRERIRQIENESLKKLENLPEAQKLRDEVEIASGYPPRPLGDRGPGQLRNVVSTDK